MEKQLAKLIKTLLPKINIITTFDEKAPEAFFPQAPRAIRQLVEARLQKLDKEEDGLIHSIILPDESVYLKLPSIGSSRRREPCFTH